VTHAPPQEPSADPRDALIAAQAQRIAALEALVADLRERLAAAERTGSRNSGNSSMPPSADDLPGRKMPRKQRRTGERAEKKRNRGKQPGSPGAAMRWELPDRTEDHYPQGECACGRDLADAADRGVTRSYQQEEIPAAPAVERCQQLIAEVTGAAVSAGFVHSCLRQTASLAAEVVRLIRILITAAAVAGFDETTLRSGPAGARKYVHGAFTEEYSAFWLGARSLDSMADAGILPEFAGAVVSDRYQNHFHPGGSILPGTRRAWLTSCVTIRTAPRPIQAPSGRSRRSGRSGRCTA
jgi:transposase